MHRMVLFLLLAMSVPAVGMAAAMTATPQTPPGAMSTPGTTSVPATKGAGRGEFDLSAFETPPMPPMPLYVSRERPVLNPKEKTALQLSRAFYDRNVPPVLAENGRVTYAYGMVMPSVVCAPLMVSDVEFQSGEVVNDVVMGDTARWQVTLARSGSPEATHLVVKPLDAGLETMAVVTTDKRVYHIQFKSQPKGHMAYVGFVYPEESAATLQQQIEAQKKKHTWNTASVPGATPGAGESVDISRLAFNYTVSGSAPWKPVQVYNDGRQTYVRLPKTVGQTELPVLLVRREGGDVLVNYRVKDDTLVVDDIFAEAVLLAGVGSKQQRVTIKRK